MAAKRVAPKIEIQPTTELVFETAKRENETMSGLLVPVIQKAKEIAFFETLVRDLKVKMKVVVYTPQQKIETIVAGLAVGCEHIAQMQTKLVPDTVAAGLFGLERFPDQAQINAFLRRLDTKAVAALGEAHQTLLLKNTQARDRSKWLRLGTANPSGTLDPSDKRPRVLPIDLDQTPLVTRSKRATGIAKGHFGRKRGQVGYKKSLALLGGGVKEVLWLRLEPGNTHGQDAVPEVLTQVATLCQALSLRPDEILFRADAQYGALDAVRAYQAAEHHYVVKGYTPLTAQKLVAELPEGAAWTLRGQDSNGSEVSILDLGTVSLRSDHDKAEVPSVRTRVVLLRRTGTRTHHKRGKGSPNVVTEEVVSYEHYLTDYDAAALSADGVIELYNGRETEESFFRAEQDGFGAQYLRTSKGEGEAAFLWLLASTVNLLRWVQNTVFAGTELEQVGLSKLVHQAMRIPATIIRSASTWIILLPEMARLTRQLVNAWIERYRQLPLPLDLSTYCT